MDNKLKILIVDDEEVVINSIQKILKLEELESDYSFDSETALLLLQTNHYDLIICDIMLPEMDGFGFLMTLNSNHDKTPVILTTGYSTMENAVKALYYGAIDFIPKPFTIDEMLSVIRRGLVYSQFQSGKINDDSLLLVPCPAQYARLGYSSWMKKENDGSALIGATNIFIKTIEPVSKIELMQKDEIINQASTCAQFISSDDTIHQLCATISGRILQVNDKLIEDPQLIEKDPYFEGWIYKIIPSELEFEQKHLIPCSSDR